MSELNEFAFLVNKLQSPNASVRKKAVKSLIKHKIPEVIPILKNHIKNEKISAIRYFARKGINFLEQYDHNYVKTPDEINSSHLDNKDPEMRTEIIKKIVDFNHSEFLPVLIRKLEVEKNDKVIATLVKAIGFFGTYDEIKIIKPFLRSSDPRVKANTIEALELIGDERIYPLIIPFVKDKDNRVKANALKALVGYKQIEIVSLLSDMLDSKEVWLRDSAVYALSALNSENVKDLLRKAANDNIKAIRDKATLGLAKLENEHLQNIEIEKKIKQFTANEVDELKLLDTLIKKERISTVKHSKPEKRNEKRNENIYAIINKLDSLEINTRKKAVISLGKTGDRTAIEPLYSMLNDKSKVVRYFSLRSIKQINSVTKDIYQCPNCGFRRTHSEILNEIRDRENKVSEDKK